MHSMVTLISNIDNRVVVQEIVSNQVDGKTTESYRTPFVNMDVMRKHLLEAGYVYTDRVHDGDMRIETYELSDSRLVEFAAMLMQTKCETPADDYAYISELDRRLECLGLTQWQQEQAWDMALDMMAVHAAYYEGK